MYWTLPICQGIGPWIDGNYLPPLPLKLLCLDSMFLVYGKYWREDRDVDYIHPPPVPCNV